MDITIGPADASRRGEWMIEFFRTLSLQPGSTEDLTAAAGVWVGYAELVEATGFKWADSQFTHSAMHEVEFAHRRAVECLMFALEKEGIDSGPVAEAAATCRRLFASDPLHWMCPSRSLDTWPECLGNRITELTPDERKAVRQAEAAMLRLDVRKHPKFVREPSGGVTPERKHAVRRIVAANPTATQDAIRQELAKAGGVGMRREARKQTLDELRAEGVYKVPANRRKNS